MKEYHPIYGFCPGIGHFVRVYICGKPKRVALLGGFDSLLEAEDAYAFWRAQSEASK